MVKNMGLGEQSATNLEGEATALAEAMEQKTPQEIKYTLISNDNDAKGLTAKPKINRPPQKWHKKPSSRMASSTNPSRKTIQPVGKIEKSHLPRAWDIKFAGALIALVILINLSLTLILGNHDRKSARTVTQPISASTAFKPEAKGMMATSPAVETPISTLSLAPPVGKDGDNASAKASSAIPAQGRPSPETPPVFEAKLAESTSSNQADGSAPVQTPAAISEEAISPSAGIKLDRERLLQIINQY